MSESARRIAELQRELAGNPASRQFYQLGELLRRDGKAPEAAEALRAGLAHHPRYVAAWVALGRACLDSGQPSEAVHTLEQAIALDPQNPVAWRLLGEGHLALGERPEALEAMKHCLQLVPGDEVLQSAVDAIVAEMAAPVPPTEPHEAEAPAAALIEPDEVFAAAEEVEEAAAAPKPPPVPEPTPDELVWEPEPAPPVAESGLHVESPAPPPRPAVLEAQPVAGQETAEDLFGGPPHAVEPPPEPAPVSAPAPASPAATAAQEAPAPQPTGEAELFTAPEAEEAPALLKKVLQAPTPEPRLDAAAVQPPASLTLARLYVQQEALGESVRILERLLEREPGNAEARDLLALVRDIMEPLPASPPKLSPRERRIAALQRWLASLTLGRERATR
jgi:cytochrome c-type biogenesis protein CcmH/NrfG